MGGGSAHSLSGSSWAQGWCGCEPVGAVSAPVGAVSACVGCECVRGLWAPAGAVSASVEPVGVHGMWTCVGCDPWAVASFQSSTWQNSVLVVVGLMSWFAGWLAGCGLGTLLVPRGGLHSLPCGLLHLQSYLWRTSLSLNSSHTLSLWSLDPDLEVRPTQIIPILSSADLEPLLPLQNLFTVLLRLALDRITGRSGYTRNLGGVTLPCLPHLSLLAFSKQNHS